MISVKKIWIAVCAVGLLYSSAAWAEDASPKQVVVSTIESIIHVLESRNDTKVMTEQDRNKIREVVTGKFDYKEMSRRSVGRAWKAMDEDKKLTFIDVFRQVLEYSYGNQLAGYHGQKVQFQDADFKKDKARVKGMVVDTNKSIPMEYRLHQTAIGWQVYDIKIEGVSMVTTFRKDFKSVIKKHGVDSLIAKLKQKAAKLKAKG
ncbi:MAG: ABC transporter substrate-binding protein [Ghiorsea sp.]